MKTRVKNILFIISCALALAVLLIAVYAYTNQLEDCDSKHGVLVKSGISNVCVEEKNG